MKQIEISQLAKHPWYKQWFDSHYYHQLYKNRDEAEATEFIENLMNVLQPRAFARMIDVGCGGGRHCIQLAKKGFQVTGIDLALQSIRHARNYEMKNLRFFQHDMRKNFGYHHFDYVFNFFTSFGYFRDRDEHDQVIAHMADALKPGGKLVIDYINIYRAAAELKESELKYIDGVQYRIQRWVTNSHFYKKISISDQRMLSDLEHTEQVARFSLKDFQHMLGHAGMQVEQVFGDYQMKPYDRRESPRLIMIIGEKDLSHL